MGHVTRCSRRPSRRMTGGARLPDWMPGAGTHVVYHLTVSPSGDPENDLVSIYIGVTSNLRRRLREHAKTRWWWPLVDLDLSEFQVFDTREEANTMETRMIGWYLPDGNRTWWRSEVAS